MSMTSFEHLRPKGLDRVSNWSIGGLILVAEFAYQKNSSEVAYLLYMWGYQSKAEKIEDGQEYSVAYSPFVDSLRFSLKTLPPAPHKYWHDAIGYKIQDTKNGMAFICDLDNNSFVPLTGQFRFVSISRNLIEFYLEGENENGEKYIVISKQK